MRAAIIGELIKARQGRGITQEQLAEMCDLSAHIGHVERGTRALSLETLVKISLILDVSTDYLLMDIVADKDMTFETLRSVIIPKKR